MSKKKNSDDVKAPVDLSEVQRAKVVLASQGQGVRLVDHLGDAQLSSLAELCTADGKLASNVVDAFAVWHRGYHEALKATSDELEG